MQKTIDPASLKNNITEATRKNIKYHQKRFENVLSYVPEDVRRCVTQSRTKKRRNRVHKWRTGERLQVESVRVAICLVKRRRRVKENVYFLAEIFVAFSEGRRGRDTVANVCSRHSNAARESMFRHGEVERQVRGGTVSRALSQGLFFLLRTVPSSVFSSGNEIHFSSPGL